jgi:glycosyltransferase involved in cell wall biosynthesis
MRIPIAVIIPALDEAPTIAGVVTRCREALDDATFETAVLVVDDGSTDATGDLAREAGARVLVHSRNYGVGKAFRTGMEAALRSGARIIVNIDADGQFDPGDIPALIAPLLEDRADFVSASRFKDSALCPRMPGIKRWGNHLMSRIISAITGERFYDVSCGFRAFNREAALRLNLWGAFTYTQECFIDMHVKNMRIAEVPLRIRGVREHGPSRVADNLAAYGYRAMKIILHSYRDYWPLRFFGALGACFMAPGAMLVLFLFWHRFTRGVFSPHIWAGFTGTGLFAFGAILFMVGLAAEMLKRIRLNQELLLYYERRRAFASPGSGTEFSAEP